MKKINIIFLMMFGILSYAQNTGQVVLDPMNITCPLLPLTVSGNFINPSNHELESLTLHVKNNSNGDEEATLDQYTLFGNEFRFNVRSADLFSSATFNKQFKFSVTATFKLIGGDSTMDVENPNNNSGPDVTFTEDCKICTTCNSAIQGVWLAGLTSNYLNNWIEYLDLEGYPHRVNIGYYDCKKIIMSKLINSSNVGPCNQP